MPCLISSPKLDHPRKDAPILQKIEAKDIKDMMMADGILMELSKVHMVLRRKSTNTAKTNCGMSSKKPALKSIGRQWLKAHSAKFNKLMGTSPKMASGQACQTRSGLGLK